ncbi:hypothetical protein PF011_g6960 [Phytophthora fragariae]|uniref:Uncharacterized protein n=1 Tax=Phytophthora fragariae TaxID=53985 RepID=A0A6A3LBP3_9STRA|nr:hypothetical protein PF011_g6960 [Phytophthora fragariae]
MLAVWREARSAFPTLSKSLESSSAWGAGALLLQAAVANCCSAQIFRGNCCPDLPSDGNGIAAPWRHRATPPPCPASIPFSASIRRAPLDADSSLSVSCRNCTVFFTQWTTKKNRLEPSEPASAHGVQGCR